MKKSFVILGILTALIVLVLGTTVNAGEHHVVVVEEKEQLAHANDSLCTENHKLVKENNQLKSENASLVNQLEASKSKDSVDEDLQKKEKEFREKEYLIALYSLEKIVKEELQGTLEDLYAKGLLYHYVDPDPYMKGNKVAKGEIKKLVDKIVD